MKPLIICLIHVCKSTEILFQVAYSYTYELRPYLDLLLQMLLLDDSWQFSACIICLIHVCKSTEILFQVAYSYTYELRPYLDLLLQMLLLEDSWQNHRIHNALKGKYN